MFTACPTPANASTLLYSQHGAAPTAAMMMMMMMMMIATLLERESSAHPPPDLLSRAAIESLQQLSAAPNAGHT
jgi:hypothetical protein